MILSPIFTASGPVFSIRIFANDPTSVEAVSSLFVSSKSFVVVSMFTVFSKRSPSFQEPLSSRFRVTMISPFEEAGRSIVEVVVPLLEQMIVSFPAIPVCKSCWLHTSVASTPLICAEGVEAS